MLLSDVEHSPLLEASSTGITGDITVSGLHDSRMLSPGMTRRAGEEGCLNMWLQQLVDAPPVQKPGAEEIFRSLALPAFVDMSDGLSIDLSSGA